MTRRFPHSMSAIQQIAMALAVAGIGAGQGLAQEGAGAARRAAARMEEQAQASMLLLGQARQQYSEGKYQEALDNYRRSLTALPKSPNMEKRRRIVRVRLKDGRKFLQGRIILAQFIIAESQVKQTVDFLYIFYVFRRQCRIRTHRVAGYFQRAPGQGMVRSGFQGIFQQLDGLIVTPRLDIFLSHSQCGCGSGIYQGGALR